MQKSWSLTLLSSIQGEERDNRQRLIYKKLTLYWRKINEKNLPKTITAPQKHATMFCLLEVFCLFICLLVFKWGWNGFWSLYLCRYSKPDWKKIWATCSVDPALNRDQTRWSSAVPFHISNPVKSLPINYPQVAVTDELLPEFLDLLIFIKN